MNSKSTVSGTDGMDFAESDIVSVSQKFRADDPEFAGIDLLLTSCWPSCVQLAAESNSIKGDPLISRLASQLRPR